MSKKVSKKTSIIKTEINEEIEKHLNSLLPETREILEKSEEERIVYALTDKFIVHSAIIQVMDYLNLLMKIPKKPRMKGLILYGESGTGKTMLINEFCKKYEAKCKPEEESDEIPILIVEMPTEPKERELYDRILDAIGVPFKKTDDLLTKEKMISYYFDLLKVRLLVFDEFHNVLNGTTNQQKKVLSAIKGLTNKLQIPIVLVGTKDVLIAIETDDEVKRRFDKFELPVWQYNDEFKRLLRSLEVTLPLKKPSYLWKNEELIIWLLEKTEGILAEIVHILKQACVKAIQTGEERITLELAKKAISFLK